ncbi:MAG: ABC transporter permease [Cyanobacteria bacterium CRU_2_1]|nr:ABC transporter permease [Cyanobacteria bacterium RU_5_0]NJR60555.1 ABC transporter permease [Cyanobacteria bacterium CRU_2_1]
MTSIARKNLFEDIPRFLVAQAGIMFAVSLVTIQVGVFNGFSRSTGILIDRSAADIWVSSSDMVNLELTIPIPASHLALAQQVEGVERAEALLLGAGIWRSSEGDITTVRLFGFDPDGQLFASFPVMDGSLSDLKQPYTVITDKSNLDSLDVRQVGDTASMGSLAVTLVGLTEDTQSITSSAYLFSSLENVKAIATGGRSANLNCRLQNGEFFCMNVFGESPDENPAPTPLSATDPVTHVLIKAEPGTDLQELKQRLQQSLPNTYAFTRGEMAKRTRAYWVQRTGVGFILGLGAVVGMIVGSVIVGQILYSSVADHLKEYATLKAMGVSNRVVYSIIIQQALWMGVLGYIPSLALCIGLGFWTFATQGIMILITPLTAAGILGLTVFMCVGSALFAVQKVTRVDPAIVFKS